MEEKTKLESAADDTAQDYETPTVEYLGKLGTLIQGVSGTRRDNFPLSGSQP